MKTVVTMPKPKVLICLDEAGSLSVISDIPCDVICVDERSPDDYIYRMQPQRHGRQLVRDTIGPYALGHAKDGYLSPEEVAEIEAYFRD